MTLIDFIMQLFSSGEYDEEIVPTHKDDSEDQETYYVPPYEEQNFDESSIGDPAASQEEIPPFSFNSIDSIQDEDGHAANASNPFSELDNNSEEEISHTEEVNRGFQLQKDVISTIEEFDTYLSRIENEDAKELVSLFQYRLIEAMVKSGSTPIDKEIEFDCLRHVPVPFSIVQDGTPIKEVLRIGLEYNGSVVLKARVKL